LQISALRLITGAADRTRTYDPIITNDVLYHLSYSGNLRRVLALQVTFENSYFPSSLLITSASTTSSELSAI
jgi:hypothetical protein